MKSFSIYSDFYFTILQDNAWLHPTQTKIQPCKISLALKAQKYAD
jgi:hypothetical protein